MPHAVPEVRKGSRSWGPRVAKRRSERATGPAKRRAFRGRAPGWKKKEGEPGSDGPRRPGFVGAHHIDAVRRLGFVDVVAVASSSERSARAKADALGVPKAYGSYEALAADPDVHVVHNTTPNHLHVPVIMAALTHRKHVVSDKPLALNTDDARALVNAATEAGVCIGHVQLPRQSARAAGARVISDGENRRAHFVHGEYLQDWLLQATISLALERRRRKSRRLATSDRTGATSSSMSSAKDRVGAGRSQHVRGYTVQASHTGRRSRAATNAEKSSACRSEDLATVLVRV